MATRDGDAERPSWDISGSELDGPPYSVREYPNIGGVPAQDGGGADIPDDPPVILVDGVEVRLDDDDDDPSPATTAATGALATHEAVDPTIPGVSDTEDTTDTSTEPRTVGLGTLRAFRVALPPRVIRDLRTHYDRDIQAYREALQHPEIYQRTVSTTPPDQRPETERRLQVPDFLGTFYGASREAQRQHAAATVQSAGIRLLSNPDMSILDAARLNQDALDGTYTLTANLAAVHTSKATFPNFPQLTGPQRLAAIQGLADINRIAKPPEIADLMRNYIPRYAWSPHPVPEDVPIPPDYAERFMQLWSGHTPADTSYLTLSSELEAGTAPLHIGMEAARAAEADGYPDLGYAVRTRLVIETLRSEAAKFDGLECREIPYYRHLIPAALSGLLALPRGAHTDYRAQITETIEQTWLRLERETSSGQPGPATTFLNELVNAYQSESAPDILPALARSAVQYAQRSTFDLTKALRGLRNSGAPWAETLINEVAEQPNRPILTNEEAHTIVTEYATPNHSTPAAEEVGRVAMQLREQSDLFSVRLPLADVASVSSHHAYATIAVDITSTEATATICYAENGNRLQVPVTMNLEDGTVSVNTIDTAPLDTAVTRKYGALVSNAILGIQAKRDALAAEAAQAQRESTATRSTADTPVRHQRERATARIKTRGVARLQDVALPIDPDTAAATGTGRVTLVGLTTDSVRQLLGSEHIKEIDADSLVQKVLFLADRTNRDEGTGTPFGRRSGAVIKGHAVRLRQLNWITGQGHRQIRVYFREHGGGTLELCGILDKKSDAQQSKYLTKLADRLLREDRKRNR